MARPNGKAMPASDTIADRRALRLMILASISRPTMKRNRQRPILATRDKYGSDWEGNMCWVKPGIRPRAVGPRRMPPSTSAMTFGCFILPKPRESSWAIIIMTPTWMIHSLSGSVTLKADGSEPVSKPPSPVACLFLRPSKSLMMVSENSGMGVSLIRAREREKEREMGL